MDFKFPNAARISFGNIVCEFQTFRSFELKTVTVSVNIRLRYFFQHFSPNNLKTLAFSEFS